MKFINVTSNAQYSLNRQINKIKNLKENLKATRYGFNILIVEAAVIAKSVKLCHFPVKKNVIKFYNVILINCSSN